MELKSKLILFLFFAVFLSSYASALNLEIEKPDKIPVVISELKEPAVFDLIINNKGSAESVEIYSLVGVSFEPKGTFNLPSGESTLNLKANPGESARSKEGNYAFEYQIKGTSYDIFKDIMTIKIVRLKNVLEIEPQNIEYGSTSNVIKIRNVQNLKLDKAKLELKSVFFDEEETISLGPFESTNLIVPVKTNLKDLAAGPYVLTSKLSIGDVSAEITGAVNYIQKQSIIMSKSRSGWIVIKTTINKTNEGNLEVPDKIEITKNVLTRLFTTFSIGPLSVERKGLLVYYRWEKDLKPGESWGVDIKTNYILPFALLILVILGASFVYVYSRTAVVVRKRCSFVRTKGGEFALKVILHVKARKEVDNIEVFDRIPMATKLYEKAGMPHKFDENTKKLSWKIDRLNAGEERIFSYIIYSTLKIVGRLELQPATAHFVTGGKSTYVNSNRTFFMSEIHPRE